MLADLPLSDLQRYRPDVAEPADFGEFWAGELGAARSDRERAGVRPGRQPGAARRRLRRHVRRLRRRPGQGPGCWCRTGPSAGAAVIVRVRRLRRRPRRPVRLADLELCRAPAPDHGQPRAGRRLAQRRHAPTPAMMARRARRASSPAASPTRTSTTTPGCSSTRPARSMRCARIPRPPGARWSPPAAARAARWRSPPPTSRATSPRPCPTCRSWPIRGARWRSPTPFRTGSWPSICRVNPDRGRAGLHHAGLHRRRQSRQARHCARPVLGRPRRHRHAGVHGLRRVQPLRRAEGHRRVSRTTATRAAAPGISSPSSRSLVRPGSVSDSSE